MNWRLPCRKPNDITEIVFLLPGAAAFADDEHVGPVAGDECCGGGCDHVGGDLG